MTYHYYDMGFKDGYKKALQEQKRQQINEAPGGFQLPPDWVPRMSDPNTREMLRFVRNLLQNTPVGVFGSYGLAMWLYTMQQAKIMTSFQAQSMVTFMRNAGLITTGSSFVISNLLRGQVFLGQLAIPAIEITLTGSMAAALAAVLAALAAAGVALWFQDDISTWIADNILGYDMEDLGYYLPKHEYQPHEIKTHSGPRIDPNAGPPMKTSTSGVW